MTTLTIHDVEQRSEYRAVPALSGSAISDLLRSPAAYKWRLENPTSTEAMKLGTLVHALVLGQPVPFAVNEFSYQKQRAEWTARRAEIEAAGQEAIGQEAWDTANAMADAVAAHETASGLLALKGVAELPVFWTEGDTPCKGQIDYLPTAGPVIDLKTTNNIDEFDKSIGGYGYHAQLMHYRRGALANGYPADERPLLIVVESSGPYRVQVFQLSEPDADQGEAMCLEAYRRYADCVAADSWPSGLPDGITETDVPTWAYRRWNNLITPDLTTYETALSEAFGGSND